MERLVKNKDGLLSKVQKKKRAYQTFWNKDVQDLWTSRKILK